MRHAGRISPDVDRIRRALEVVAALVIEDPVYEPVFRRLQEELAQAEAAADLVSEARSILARKDEADDGPDVT
ncbi:hypothetical protein [Tranquillimonas rosea]|uniref:hypothetical protein n=1 Tax=Tranquillimonas rosea TaxID=641238 RepID=UPI003BACE2F6